MSSSGAPATPPAWTRKDSGPASRPSRRRPATRPASTSTPCRITSGTRTTRPRAGRCLKSAAATAMSSCGPQPDPDDGAARRAHPAPDLPGRWNPGRIGRGSLPPSPGRRRPQPYHGQERRTGVVPHPHQVPRRDRQDPRPPDRSHQRGRLRRQLTPTPTRQFLHRIGSTDDRSKGSMHARLRADADHAVSSA